MKLISWRLKTVWTSPQTNSFLPRLMAFHGFNIFSAGIIENAEKSFQLYNRNPFPKHVIGLVSSLLDTVAQSAQPASVEKHMATMELTNAQQTQLKCAEGFRLIWIGIVYPSIMVFRSNLTTVKTIPQLLEKYTVSTPIAVKLWTVFKKRQWISVSLSKHLCR